MALYTIRRVNYVTDEYRDFVILNKSNHSYAINNKIVSLFNGNSWSGKRCFIVGGGESMEGFDFSRLNGELTIGINKSFKLFPDSTINYCMDHTFYDQMRNGDFDKPGEPTLQSYWRSYKGIRVFLTPMELKEFGKEVYLVKRLLDPEINRESLDHGIYQGTNSGTGAICLAAALGAKEIFLLGYDLKAVNKTHWHGGYEQRDIEKFSKKLSDYCNDIAILKPLLDQAGVRVVNLNLDSALKCFDFSTFDSTIGCVNANI